MASSDVLETAGHSAERFAEIRNNNNQDNNDQQTAGVEKLKLIQRQLILLFHAENCCFAPKSEQVDFTNNAINGTNGFGLGRKVGRNSRIGTANCTNAKSSSVVYCTFPHCTTMKDVLHHLKTCQNSQVNPKCSFPYCFSSRHILTHWNNCGGAALAIPDDKVGKICSMCDPVKKIVFNSSPVVSGSELPCSLKRNRKASEDQELDQREPELPRKQACLTSKNSNKNGSDSDLVVSEDTMGPKIFNITLDSLKNEIWSGALEWFQQPPKESTIPIKTDREPLLSCKAYRNKVDESIQGDQWPSVLRMKLIPSSILWKLGGISCYYNKEMEKLQVVLFEFDQPGNDLKNLKEAMESGCYSGYVHFEYPAAASVKQEPTADAEDSSSGKKFLPKVLILHYNPKLESFLGFIPVHQQQFVDRLRFIVYEEKMKISQQKFKTSPNPTGTATNDEKKSGKI